jgi:hypothetical protein
VILYIPLIVALPHYSGLEFDVKKVKIRPKTGHEGPELE